MSIQKHERRESLRLGRRTDVLCNRKVVEELLDLVAPKLPRMSFAMEEDVSPSPVDVRLGGARTAVAHAQRIRDLHEELGLACHLSSIIGGRRVSCGLAHAARVTSIPRAAARLDLRGANRHPPSDHVASSRIDEAMRREANPSANQRVCCSDGGSSDDFLQFGGDAAEQTSSVVTPSELRRAIPSRGSTASEGAFGFDQADQPLREQRQSLSGAVHPLLNASDSDRKADQPLTARSREAPQGG